MPCHFGAISWGFTSRASTELSIIIIIFVVIVHNYTYIYMHNSFLKIDKPALRLMSWNIN